mgnify:CR=1 FL=1
MKTTLFLSVSVDGLISDKNGIPYFPDGAWQDWCSLVNGVGNVIAGRSSYEQLKDDEMGSLLNPQHMIVLSSRDLDTGDSGWQHAKSPEEALEILESAGVNEAIIGGGRAVNHSFLKKGLIDYIILDLQPVAFGTGTPIFGDEMDVAQLKLINSRPINDGVIRLKYEVIHPES